MSRALDTLFHPFLSGAVAVPGDGQRLLFLGAVPGFHLPPGFPRDIELVQGFRPLYLRLQAAGHVVRPAPEGHEFDGALVLCTRHRGENENHLAEAIRRVRPGGLIVAAGSAEDGISSLRKRLQALLPLAGHLPKYHGLVFWLQRPGPAAAEAACAVLRPAPVLVEGRFATAPGMFSHGRIDPGSRLLAGHLPVTGRGAAADFGAGWGYLAAELAERTQGLAAIDLYEADHGSLQAARRNLSTMSDIVEIGFFWHDLASEKVERRYELIVMNPPFHQGRAAEPDVGRAMIRAAAAALRPGGRLFMVQNRGLPYAATLKEGFSDVAEIASDASFRVVTARR